MTQNLTCDTHWQARLPSPYRHEAAVAQEALDRLRGRLDWSLVVALATPWVEAVRRDPPPLWSVESLLQTWPLHSQEGQALMRLAEALLRIPDATTAQVLLTDLLGRAARAATSLHAPMSPLIRRTLALVGQWPSPEAHPTAWQQLGTRSLLRLARQATQLLGQQFVLGQTLPQALHSAQRLRESNPGLRFSFDMLGEGARDSDSASRYLTQYDNALCALAVRAQAGATPLQQDGISIKLSALHPRFEAGQRNRVLQELVPRVWSLCETAAGANLNLTLDAEESERLELTLDVFEALLERVSTHHPQWTGLGLALQAYQTRALALVDHIISLARKHRVRTLCRLVKGAYWDSEIKRAQELGLPHYPVFTHKHHTDLCYLACAQALLAAPDAVLPQFASHNAATLAAVWALAGEGPHPPTERFELQRLHGMGEGLYQTLQASLAGAPRVYAPVGTHRELLAYLVRRLLENGANASFVHHLADPATSLETLLASPLRVSPGSALPLPGTLFRPRRNSEGLDMCDPSIQSCLQAAWAQHTVPTVATTLPEALPAMASIAAAAFPAWRDLDPSQRTAAVHLAANALQDALPEFAALLVHEARKTWNDAVTEVRETIDFLRYYAQEAGPLLQPRTLPGPTGEHNTWRLRGRGVWVCISPWNFPLAIFTGQLAAALVTGNTVLAKPAEQTSGVAAAMVQLLHHAGIPVDALQLVHGSGETVGAGLVRLPGIAGVAFTGSVAVARQIQHALAAGEGPLLPLIAETGGINAMLVDSSALPEQVCDAVVLSNWRSAGQRCSALRLLCVHASVADALIDLLRGAAQEQVIGDPARFDTDLGPLIDAEAHARVTAQIDALRQRARLLWSPPEDVPQPWLGPHLFEVRHPQDVQEEIFGPVLCVLRWGSGSLDSPQAVVEAVNALGYGLTFGIQTRIEGRAQALAQQVQAGNVYVNRGMTGAVVGAQPFGGQGLSGTGPKAGGPLYLTRFCNEQSLSVNTAAAGGNAALLAARDLDTSG